MNIEIIKVGSTETKNQEDKASEKLAAKAVAASSNLPSGATSCTCPPENRQSRWAAQEHMEWIRFNLDPNYPYLINEVSEGLENTKFESSAAELSDNASDTGSEPEGEEEEVNAGVPSGVLALWQILRDDSSNENEEDVTENY